MVVLVLIPHVPSLFFFLLLCGIVKISGADLGFNPLRDTCLAATWTAVFACVTLWLVISKSDETFWLVISGPLRSPVITEYLFPGSSVSVLTGYQCGDVLCHLHAGNAH